MNDDLIIQALGGKPGDVLVRNPDGSATLQEGPKLTDTVQGGFGNTNPAAITGPEASDNRVLRDLGKQSAGQRVIGPGTATALAASDAVLPAAAAIGTGLGVAALAPESALAGLAVIPLSIGAGMATSYGQQALYSDAHKQLLAEARQQQPIASTVGGLIPSALTGKVTLDPWRSAGRLARNATRTSIPLALREGLAAGDVANTVGLGAGVTMPAINAYKEYRDTGTVHPVSAAMDVAAGALLGDLNTPTKKAINAVTGRQLAHIGPGYRPQTGEQLRQGLDKLAPLNVDTAQPNPYDIPVADTVSSDAGQLGYSDPEKLAADMAKGAEKSRKREQTELVSDAKQRFEYAKKVGPGPEIDYGTRLNNTAADAERNPSINRAEIDAILTAEGLTDAEKLAKLQGLTAPTIENRYTPDAPHTPIVPDNPATVQQQLELALDPNSSRKAVLLTPGTQMPGQLPVRLRSVETLHGEVVYNPDKISLKEIFAAAQGDELDARILGMSQFSKPGDPEAVAVTTARKNQPNVQAEAAAGEGISGAVAAAENANPGEPVEIKPSEQVLQERQPGLTGDDVILLSSKGYGEDEIAGRVGDKRANLLGGISRSLEAGGHDVVVQPTDKPYSTEEYPVSRFGLQHKYEGANNSYVEYGTSAHAAPHEAVHAIYEGLPKSEQARLDAAVTRSPEFQRAVADEPGLTAKEFLAQRGSVELVRQIQEKDFGLWRDLAMQVRRMFNMDTPQDAMRFINNAFTASADRPGGSLNVNQPKPVQRPTGPAGTYRRFPEAESNRENPIPKADAPQTDAEANFSKAEGIFSTELEKQARTAKPWGLLPNNAGKYSAEGLIAKFRMQGKVEQSLLPGFEEWVKRNGGATKEELIQYAKENEPKAEVHTYGMDREQSEAKKELDKLTHELETDRTMKEALRLHRMNWSANEITESLRLTPRQTESLARYSTLESQIYNAPEDTSPTATHYYNSISPRPVDRPMPDWTATKGKRNLQRVDVVLPSNAEEPAGGTRPNGMDQQTWRNKEQNVMWRQDGLHENLPNTLGWAAIQYETGPNGEKIAHVIEAQSRWGQMARKARGTSHMETGEIQDHPLLNDYNRLILKAAIEQARKEGATHIAISDAETAMMTEMHDQQLPADNDFASTREAANRRAEQLRNEGYVNVTVERSPGARDWVIRFESAKPTQEPGMRFNYDAKKGQLHRIASELTGHPGEDISFGEHKNAMYKAEYGSDVETVYKPRPDLILKNPDGTPKTTATGRLYPIDVPAARREAGEPFTYGRANYSTPVKGPKVPDDFKTSDVRGFSLIDRIANAPLRQSANEAQAEKSRLLGYGYKAVRDNKSALKEADLDKMADAFNGKAPPLTDPASQAVYKMFRTAADWINSNGPARTIVPKAGYVPQMFHPEVRQVFKDAVNSPDAKAIKAALVAHYQKGMKRDAAVKAVDKLATAIHTNPSYDPSTDFGPLHKAAGMGLPAEVAAPSGVIRIRDNDMLRVAQTYFARAATDLAYHNAVTKRFGANGGNESDSAFQRWRQSFTGQPESDADQLLRSSTRAGSSVVVSTLSGLNNIVAIPQQAMAFTGKHGPFTTAAALIDTITAPRASHEASIAAGHTRPGQNDMTFKQTRDTNLAAAVLDASADTMRLITGSTALENISRAWTYNIGKRAARNMIDAGDHDKMLRLGVQPSDPKAEEKLAASIANHIEGTYDGRELPGPLVEGKLGTLLSIHKWSIEKMNSAYKDLYVPATKGDLWPLLWTVAMAAGVTIPAAKELKEAVNRKKGAPELDEINAAEKVTGKKDWLARTAWLTQLLSMASIAGYASQAANAATQTAAGRKDQNLVFVPLSELAGEELSNLVGNASQALRKGEDLDTIGPQFAKDLLKIMVQGSQAVLNRLPGQEANVQAASDNRDLAVYNNLVNKKMPSEARANDLDGALEREFKQEQDPVRAGELLRKIADRYREKFKDDPFMLTAKLRSLREMNGIGFPTEGNEAGRYKQYLDEAYGPEGASNRVHRAAYRDALNRGKVEALDKGGMKPPPAKPNPFRK